MKKLFVTALIVAALGSGVLAIKPAPSFIVLDQTDVGLGDWVTFTTSFPASLNAQFVYVQVACYQTPDHIFRFGVTDAPDANFLLGGTDSYWLKDEGPASCVAELFYWAKNGKYTVLAATEFEAAGL